MQEDDAFYVHISRERSGQLLVASTSAHTSTVVPRLQQVVIVASCSRCMNTILGPCLHIRQDDGHSGLI